MTERAVIYDVTRLSTRFSRPAPNGIDRVDAAYATHFLYRDKPALGVLWGRVIATNTARRILAAVLDHWREAETGAAAHQNGTAKRPSSIRSVAKLFRNGPMLGQQGLLTSGSLARQAPRDAVYLNTAQFPLWEPRYFRWLKARKDIDAIFFLHDLLPLDFPEYFPKAELPRHQKRVETLCAQARGVIVSSQITADGLRQQMDNLQREGKVDICVNALGVEEAFRVSDLNGNASNSKPFFLSIGTLEPRKNHLLLLNVWRDLVKTLGPDAPQLVLVGAKGWGCDNVHAMLTRCPALENTVKHVPNASTPELVELIAGSKAVLIPTFAEGFGLPVLESLAAGGTVIASKIPAFSAIDDPNLILLDPLNGSEWTAKLLALTAEMRRPVSGPSEQEKPVRRWPDHMRTTEAWLQRKLDK